jgi:hypothetical protein
MVASAEDGLVVDVRDEGLKGTDIVVQSPGSGDWSAVAGCWIGLLVVSLAIPTVAFSMDFEHPWIPVELLNVDSRSSSNSHENEGR